MLGALRNREGYFWPKATEKLPLQLAAVRSQVDYIRSNQVAIRQFLLSANSYPRVQLGAVKADVSIMKSPSPYNKRGSERNRNLCRFWD